MTPGFYITGTNTGVGKSHVTRLIARALVKAGHKVGVYKPVATDCKRDGNDVVAPDALKLWEAAGRPGTLEEVCPQRFVAPMAPPTSARLEGREVDCQLLRTGLNVWRERSDIVLVEGAGGLLSPMSDKDDNSNLAAEFGFPLVVVAVNELGTINATLLTLLAAKTLIPQVPIAGVVLNRLALFPDDESTKTNAEEIACRTDVPVLTCVNYQQQDLRDDVDWFALASSLSKD
ncbi:MAG: dethiobiotin synthase [Bythopirellula sp.]|nr:dethiobiotin synthase [Bythopirellula sp.]